MHTASQLYPNQSAIFLFPHLNQMFPKEQFSQASCQSHFAHWSIPPTSWHPTTLLFLGRAFKCRSGFFRDTTAPSRVIFYTPFAPVAIRTGLCTLFCLKLSFCEVLLREMRKFQHYSLAYLASHKTFSLSEGFCREFFSHLKKSHQSSVDKQFFYHWRNCWSERRGSFLSVLKSARTY